MWDMAGVGFERQIFKSLYRTVRITRSQYDARDCELVGETNVALVVCVLMIDLPLCLCVCACVVHLQLCVECLQPGARVLQAEGVTLQSLQLLPEVVARLLGPGQPGLQRLSLRYQHRILGGRRGREAAARQIESEEIGLGDE